MAQSSLLCVSSLPDELWLRVLGCAQLPAASVCRFAACSIRCQALADTNAVWQQKFTQTFPSSVENAAVFSDEFSDELLMWKAIYKCRHRIKNKVCVGLSELSGMYICRPSLLVAYCRIGPLMLREQPAERLRPVVERFTVDQLRCVINDQQPHKNLTDKYYAQQCVAHIIHEQQKQWWPEWLADPESDLIEGVCRLDEWFRPQLCSSRTRVRGFIERLAAQVVEQLRLTHPNHPFHRRKTAANVSASEGRALVAALAHVFAQEKLVGDSDNDESDCVQRLCIGYVLDTKLGRPIMFCMLAQLVAGRLGLALECIRFPGRLMLRYDEHAELTDDGQRYTYLDVWDRFRARDEQQLWTWYAGWAGDFERDANALLPATNEMLLRRCCNNALNARQHDVYSLLHPLELCALFTREWRVRRHLAQLYTDNLCTNRDIAVKLLEDAPDPSSAGGCPFMGQISSLKQQLQRDLQRFGVEPPSKPIDVMLRSQHANVKYAVGQIMQHRKYNYKCVIMGWDPVCSADVCWQRQMGVHKLQRADKQPFYHVLVSDGSSRYAAEDNLEYEPSPVWIEHDSVPRYFNEFGGTHYVSNAQHRLQYPEDTQALKQYVTVFYKDADVSQLEADDD